MNKQKEAKKTDAKTQKYEDLIKIQKTMIKDLRYDLECKERECNELIGQIRTFRELYYSLLYEAKDPSYSKALRDTVRKD